MNNISIQKDQDSDAYQKRMPNLARRIEKVRKASASRLRKSWDDLLNSVGYDGTDRTFLDLPIPPSQKKAIKEKAKSVPRVTDTILKRMLGVYTARKALQDLGRIEASKGAEEMQEAMRPAIVKTVEEAHSRTNFNIAKEVGITDTYEPPSETYVERIANRHTPYTLAHSYTLRAMSEPMYKTLMQGILAGKNPNEIGRQLAKQQEDLLPYRAKMIARTLITEASADTEAQALKDAGLDEYRFMAGLDEKTCEVCGHLDGQVFKLDDRERGKNCPPMHLNCRCTVACVISEKYRKDTETRSARSTKGKWTKVPATMTYDEWKAQNEDRLKEMRTKKRLRVTVPKPRVEMEGQTGEARAEPSIETKVPNLTKGAEQERVRKSSEAISRRDEDIQVIFMQRTVQMRNDAEIALNDAVRRGLKSFTIQMMRSKVDGLNDVLEQLKKGILLKEVTAYPSILKEMRGIYSSANQEWLDLHNADYIRMEAVENDIEYRDVERLVTSLTDEEIIQKLGGGDRTGGSCSSLVIAYIANKHGYDVTDFRGNESRVLFSGVNWTWQRYAQVEETGSEIEDSIKLLNSMELGKEYQLSTGSHTAMVRRTESGFEYLELQAPFGKCGWRSFGSTESEVRSKLYARFGADRYEREDPETKKKHLRKYRKGYLFDPEKLAGDKDYINLAGYINTNPTEQMKGDKGYEK